MNGLYEQFRIALHQVWQRRWLAVAVAWGLCLVGWLVIALIPNSYESKARVFVQSRQILPGQNGYTPPVDRQAELLRVQQTLLSARNLERVVRRTELNSQVASERDLAREVEKLRQNIRIQGQLDGTVEIVVSLREVSWEQPEPSALVYTVPQSTTSCLLWPTARGNTYRNAWVRNPG